MSILGFVVALVGILVIVSRRLRSTRRAHSDIDAGTISESWLAEQRGSKT